MKRRQRGVALLVVLLILALMVTMSTTIAERNGRAWQRTMLKWSVCGRNGMPGRRNHWPQKYYRETHLVHRIKWI